MYKCKTSTSANPALWQQMPVYSSSTVLLLILLLMQLHGVFTPALALDMMSKTEQVYKVSLSQSQFSLHTSPLVCTIQTQETRGKHN